MEKGKSYIFYNNAYQFGREDNKIFIGEYVGEMNDGSAMIFKLSDGGMRFSTNVHDEINPKNNAIDFIEYVAEKFQNKFERNVSVWHENFEFKINIPHDGGRILDDVEELMSDILEDWWSVQWHELETNSIQVKWNDVIVSFRLHEIHEVQFRFNEGGI